MIRDLTGVFEMETFVLQAEKRDGVGKGNSKKLRRDGYMPGIIYGGSKDVVNIKIEHNAMLRNLEKEGFYSNILEISLSGKSEKVFLKDLHRHPARKEVLHADFQRVEEAVELSIRVPIHLINEDNCIGIKQGGGVVSRLLNEVEVTCLPKDLPPFIEVDIENLNLGEAVHFSELQLPDGVRLTALLKGGDETTGVVQVMTPKGMAADDEDDANIVESEEDVVEEAETGEQAE